MTESDWDLDVEKRIEEHLDAIDRALAARGVPLSERRSVTEDVEAQIRDMLAASGKRAPTLADVEVVLGKLDGPESYGENAEIATSRQKPLTPDLGSAAAALRHIILGFMAFAAVVILGIWFLGIYFRIGPESIELLVCVLGWSIVLVLGCVALMPLAKGVGSLPTRNHNSQTDPRPFIGYVLLACGLMLVAVGLSIGPRHGPHLLFGLMTLWTGGLMLVLALKRAALRLYLAFSGTLAIILGLLTMG